MAIIHVEERDFQVEPITLQTVRPFVIDDIDLDDAIEEAQVGIDEKQAVIRVLKAKIKSLIARADREWQEKHAHLPAEEQPQKMLPLVRLRVAYTRHDTGNIVRFGQDFVDKVANPRDLLQFHKKRAAQASRRNANLKDNYLEPTEEMLPSERMEKVHMSGLVQKYLSSQSLQILNPAGLERAVMNFVDKDDRDAISHFVDKEMKTTNTGLVAINPDEAKLSAELDRIRDEKMRLGVPNDEPVGEEHGATGKEVAKTTRRGHVDSDESMLDDLDDDLFDEERLSSTQRPPAKTARGATTRSDASATPKMSQSTLMFRGNSEDEDTAPRASTSSRAAALSATAKKKTPAKKKAAAAALAAPSRAAGGRRAAQKASSRLVESQADGADEDGSFVISDSDDEFEDGNRKPKGRRGR